MSQIVFWYQYISTSRPKTIVFSLIRYVRCKVGSTIDPMYCKIIHIAIFKISYLVYNIVKQNNKGQSTSCIKHLSLLPKSCFAPIWYKVVKCMVLDMSNMRIDIIDGQTNRREIQRQIKNLNLWSKTVPKEVKLHLFELKIWCLLSYKNINIF